MENIMTNNFKATLINDTGIGVSEVACRTCYDSFDKSDNDVIRAFGNDNHNTESFKQEMNSIDDSKLLHDLSWVYHHESVLEHTVLTYHIVCSRGVLQELARHRIASYSVKSTRYCMKDIIDIYISSLFTGNSTDWFKKEMMKIDMFSVEGSVKEEEILSIYRKLYASNIPWKEVLSKEAMDAINDSETGGSEHIYELLKNSKPKRNAGDSIKFIVTDNWLTEVVMTINLRSLKNFFKLRDNGAAWKPMRHLASLIKQATPEKYLGLCHKDFK
jgi:thymidylate synthase (FAD)